MTFQFVIPDPTSFSSGGNLYNQALMENLVKRGHRVIEQYQCGACLPEADRVFWDTLHLALLTTTNSHIPDPPGVLMAHADTTALRTAIPRLKAIGLTFLATGQFMVDLLLGEGIPSDRIFLLEPPVILPLPARRDRVVQAREQLSLAMASSLTKDKGLLEFFQLGANLGRPFPDHLRIDVFGDDRIDEGYARAIKAIWKSTAWEDIVSFQGLLPRLQFLDRLPGYDALLSVSPSESYGMAIAEALSVGIPVLARSGGNVRNLVRDQENGLLFHDHHELINWLMQQPGQRHLPDPSNISSNDQPSPGQVTWDAFERWLVRRS
ncbi:MAG: glycosyltransferase [Saprospiraceae bacterium]